MPAALLARVRLRPSPPTVAVAVAVAVSLGAPAAARAEAWDFQNDPVGLDPAFSYNVAYTPTTGQPAAVPHPGWYWPTYADSINVRWDNGNLAPSEKFAFITGRASLTYEVSEGYGVLSSPGAPCASADDCSGGAECSQSLLGAASVCIDSGSGECNGWAGYSISEPGASAAVTRDGVTFYPADIDALMTLIYANAPYREIGDRCDGNVDADGVGRIVDPTCRNLNPGAYHVGLMNLVGAQSGAMLVNSDNDGRVWNRPILQYTIKNAVGGALVEVSRPMALALLGINVTNVPLQDDITLPPNTSVYGTFSAPSAGQYLFRTNAAVGNGMALDVSDQNNQLLCDSATYGNVQQCLLSLTAGESVQWKLTNAAGTNNPFSAVALITGAAISLAIPEAGDAPYLYNPLASRFFFVSTFTALSGTVDPTEQPITQAWENSEQLEYQYILEADQDGNIIGGEWAAGTKGQHPNYAWVVKETPAAAASADIQYPEVKSLLDEATGGRVNHLSHLVNSHVVSRSGVVAPILVSAPGMQ
jgi:hypothetical protein